jgi:hypothetical protein
MEIVYSREVGEEAERREERGWWSVSMSRLE